MWCVHRERDAVQDICALPAVAGCALGENRGRMILTAVGHSQRLKDSLRHQDIASLAGNLFDDAAEQHITGVGVAHLRPGLEIQRLVSEPLDRGYSRGWPALKLWIIRKGSEVGDSRRMRK